MRQAACENFISLAILRVLSSAVGTCSDPAFVLIAFVWCVIPHSPHRYLSVLGGLVKNRETISADPIQVSMEIRAMLSDFQWPPEHFPRLAIKRIKGKETRTYTKSQPVLA